MAKDTKSIAGRATLELPNLGAGARRGRKPKAGAMTSAERQAAYRARRAEAIANETARLADLSSATLARRLTNHLVATENQSRVTAGGEAEDHARHEWLAIGKRMGWLK